MQELQAELVMSQLQKGKLQPYIKVLISAYFCDTGSCLHLLPDHLSWWPLRYTSILQPWLRSLFLLTFSLTVIFSSSPFQLPTRIMIIIPKICTISKISILSILSEIGISYHSSLLILETPLKKNFVFSYISQSMILIWG